MNARPGERVRVIDGPYTGWEGEVLRVDREPPRVVVVIAVFAKPTAIDLVPSQIATVS